MDLSVSASSSHARNAGSKRACVCEDVILLQRLSHEGQFSIETVFREIKVHMKELGASVQTCTAPVKSMGLWNRIKIILWARQLRQKLIHITGDITFAALGTDPNKTIITIHDCEVLDRVSGISRAVLKFFWYTIPVRRAAAIVVISEATKRKLLSHLPKTPPSKIHVIPSATSAHMSFDPKYKLSPTPRILQIGTKHNKNLPRLIEAVREVECNLVIVGRLNVALREHLEKAKVSYENFVDLSDQELEDQYKACDIVSFVSLQEGFGMPIIEAQRIGRPVLTSDCSSMPEVAGRGAVLVTPTDIDSIRSGIKGLIADEALRRRIVLAGKQNVERFDTKYIAKAYMDLYDRVWQTAP